MCRRGERRGRGKRGGEGGGGEGLYFRSQVPGLICVL